MAACSGLSSGALFVRLQGEKLSAEGSILDGAKPFLHDFVLAAPSIESQLAPWQQRLRSLRQRRSQTRNRRSCSIDQWRQVQTALMQEAASAAAMADAAHNTPAEAYMDQVQTPGRMYTEHAMAGVLQLYALLEAERAVIQDWVDKEQAKCQDLVHQTKLLFQLNTFACHLDSETCGQVRMWRLPVHDPQRLRCIKAATENVKKSFASRRLEVLDVYKIENRALLECFQRFTSAMPASDVKIKGLFCSVPVDSIESCVVWGMHPEDDATADKELFNRVTLLKSTTDTPGASRQFCARAKACYSKRILFPRRFSRYSTLGDDGVADVGMESTSQAADQSPPVRYLALCRVAMGKTLRLRNAGDGWSFPEDPLVGTLFFANEEDYVVRYPDAVVPEFLLQYREVLPPATSAPLATRRIQPVHVGKPIATMPTVRFLEAIDQRHEPPAISAFPLAACSDQQPSASLFEKPAKSIKSRLHRHLDETKAREERVDDEAHEASVEAVLSSYAQQKKLLLEDIRALSTVFWRRATRLWEEADPDRAAFNHQDEQSHEPEASAGAHELLGELSLVRDLEKQLERKQQQRQQQPKPRRPSAAAARNVLSHKR